jgi:hypothetical protein
MSTLSRVQVRRVIDEADRRDVVTVLRATYQHEKHWVSDPETQVPRPTLLARTSPGSSPPFAAAPPACCGCISPRRSRSMPSMASS